VDIEPPPRKPGEGPTDEELRRLGLPTHHVHFNADSDDQTAEKEVVQTRPEAHQPEILRPNDISIVTYDDKRAPQWMADDPGAYFGPKNPVGWSDWTKYEEDDGPPELPRALPDTEVDGEERYADRVYEIDAICDMNCGEQGECAADRVEEGVAVIRKRCLCPMGKHGEGCSLGELSDLPFEP